jgi:hypothetical protein
MDELTMEGLRSLMEEMQTWHGNKFRLDDDAMERLFDYCRQCSLDELVKLFGKAYAESFLTPAQLLGSVKQLVRQELERKASAVPSGYKRYADMSDREKDAYIAAQQLAKQKLKANLAQLHREGKLPTTRVGGFSSIGDVMVPAMLGQALDEAAFSDRLEAAGGSFR